MKVNIFTIQWKVDYIHNVIRVVGLDENNNTVLLNVHRFRPSFYVECPKNTDSNHLITVLKSVAEDGKKLNFEFSKKFAKKIYGYNEPEYFIKCQVVDEHGSYFAVKNFIKRLNSPVILNGKEVTLKYHEDRINVDLQLIAELNISFIGWIECEGFENGTKISSCYREYDVDYRYIKPLDRDSIPVPKVLSFDIEVYNSDLTSMPSPENIKDVITHISAVTSTGVSKMFTLHESDEIEDTEIIYCKTEELLLLKYAEFVREFDPSVIIGYNILKFDIPYMVNKAKLLKIQDDFNTQGIIDGEKGYLTVKKWKSSAFGFQTFEFVDHKGRIFIDLYPVIERDYKLDNYKLNTVAQVFLHGDKKDDVTVIDINNAHKTRDPALVGLVGKYCVKDSELVLNIFNKINCWVGMCEMAKTCNVQIMDLFSSGQQIRVFSQVYKYTHNNGYIIDKQNYNSAISGYEGAYVVTPIPGMYANIIPFDFNSLYPTSIIAYNIDYTSHITKEQAEPDDYKIEWDEENGTHFEFYFKNMDKHKGIIPILLENLLSARKKVNTLIKKLKSENPNPTTEIQDLLSILDKRQLSYKISANSMYGALGVKDGYLPFMVGAACTTAIGRMSIKKAIEYLKLHHDADIVYGDTDSVMISFKKYQTEDTVVDLWKLAVSIESEINQLYRAPMRLAFEEKVYTKFLIFTKKRYMTNVVNVNNGVLSPGKMYSKGVLLSRRDNTKFVKDIYKQLIDMVFHGKSFSQCYSLVNAAFDGILNRTLNDPKLFVMTAVLKDASAYAKKSLPDDDIKKQKRLKDLNCENEDEFEEKSLPGIVQLGKLIRSRGNIVNDGERIEYVITGDDTLKKFQKMEHFDYYLNPENEVSLDRFFYLKATIKPLDQVFNIVFPTQIEYSKSFKHKSPTYNNKPITLLYERKKHFVSKVLADIRNIKVSG